MKAPALQMKRVAGLDLAKDSIYGCILGFSGFKVQERFGTGLKDLILLHHWLQSHQVEYVVMENTGIYTEPVVTTLRTHFRVEVVNAADTKRKNRKKTDPEDAWWLSQLLLAGAIGPDKAIRGSFLPDASRAELRELTRTKSRYTHQASLHKNRITKTFARLNIKLPDVFGDNKFTYSALGIYEAIARGLTFDQFLEELHSSRQQLSGLPKGRISRHISFIQKHRDELETALAQKTVIQIPRHHQLALLLELTQLTLVQDYLDLLTREIQTCLQIHEQFHEPYRLLLTVPGIGETTAAQILGEIPPIEYFTSAKQFASFAGLVPKVSKSGEVTYIGQITKRGSPYLRKALYQAAKVATMKKHTQMGRKFQRIYKRKGKGKGKIAWVAVGRHIATIIWTILTRKEEYKEERYVKKPWYQARKKLEQKTIQAIAQELRKKGYRMTVYNLETGGYLVN
ncbi:MAG: IS110 family transposase [Candidatus Hodarchaeota archaeon]